MPQPGITLNELDNQLGNVRLLDDAKACMLGFGPDADDLDTGVPVIFNTLADNIAVGIDEQYDTDNGVRVFADLKAYREIVPEGPLYFMLLAQATTMEAALDPTNDDGAKKLLLYADGLAVLTVNRKPPSGYNPTYTNGVDPDVADAVVQAALLREYFWQTVVQPCVILIGGRGLKGNLGSIQTAIQGTGKCVLVSLLGVASGSKEANIGTMLGWAKTGEIHEKLSKTARGALPLSGTVYLTNGAPAEDARAYWDTFHDRGYVFPKKFPRQSGYYLSSDATMAAADSDFNSLANCRVMGKAVALVYDALFPEINKDRDLEPNGKLAAGQIDQIEADIQNKVLQQLARNVSGLKVTLDPDSDLVTAKTLRVKKLAVQPKGYSSYIEVDYGFSATL